MRAARGLESRRVIFFIEEIVVASRVGAQFGIVVERAERQGAPLRQRPIIFAASSSSSSGLVEFAFRYWRNSATRWRSLRKTT